MRRREKSSHEALREAVGGKTPALAPMIGYSENTVYRWQLPQPGLKSGTLQNGTRNPIDLIIDIHDACMELGQSREEALQPLYYLNEALGLLAFPKPDAEGEGREVARAFIRAAAEFGDVAKEIERALDPAGQGGGRISAGEAKRLHREIQELLRHGAALDRIVQEAADE